MFGSDDGASRDRLIEGLRQRIDDPAVVDAMAAVPREEFVPDDQRSSAYLDRPLSIGKGQTISAPHMVAIMAELLDLEAGQTVLEIGTGCGYHAAVTAELVGDEGVYSVEYHPSLAASARERLSELGYDGVSIRAGDGHDGWPEHAPYDRAYLTCAAPDFPEAVVEQVRPGGVLLGPLGEGHQMLVKAIKQEDGTLERTQHGGVRFVPMQSE